MILRHMFGFEEEGRQLQKNGLQRVSAAPTTPVITGAAEALQDVKTDPTAREEVWMPEGGYSLAGEDNPGRLGWIVWRKLHVQVEHTAGKRTTRRSQVHMPSEEVVLEGGSCHNAERLTFDLLQVSLDAL